MSVISSIESQAKLNIPYSCKCPYCGTQINGSKIVIGTNVASKGGYFSENEKDFATTMAEVGAGARLLFNIKYEIKRLEHYRKLIADGKLMAYFKSGKVKKEDWFTVDKDSELGKYMTNRLGKTDSEYYGDKNRLRDYPYRWLDFRSVDVRDKIVKCPQCRKKQPWCVDASCRDCIWWVFMLAITLFIALIIPFPAFFSEQFAALERWKSIAIMVGALLVSAAGGLLLFRLVKRRRLNRLAQLDWRLENVPEYDPDFVSQWGDAPRTQDVDSE